MIKFIKLPVIAYDAKGYDKYTRTLVEDAEDDIDEMISRSARGMNYEVERPLGITTYSRYPISVFETCSYEPACSLPDKDAEFTEESFNATLISFKDGDIIQIAMDVNEFEDLLIFHGIVDPSIKEQFPKSRL
jgi:hypothetical protein